MLRHLHCSTQNPHAWVLPSTDFFTIKIFSSWALYLRMNVKIVEIHGLFDVCCIVKIKWPSILVLNEVNVLTENKERLF